MAESFITQCPHCGTSFRVRTEQLSVANGSVRCGACLQVFSARNHVVTGSIPPTPAVPKPTAIKPAPVPEKPKQPEPFEETLDLPPARPAPAPEKSVTKEPLADHTEEPDFEEFFAAEEDEDAEFIFADGDDDEDNDDEFIFSDGPNDKLFDEDEQEEGLGELSDSFLSLSGGHKPVQKADHFQQEIHQTESDDFDDDDEIDESWAESILQEMEQEEQQKKAVFDTDYSQQKEIQAEPIPIEPTPAASILDFDDDDFTIPQSASQIVNQASEEIEHDFPFEDRFQKFRPLGWLLIILLTALVVAQLAWMQRETYARMDQWRGIYAMVCDRLGCTLPDQVDLNSIRTSVLVREHKDSSLSDIYIVDVILTNKAPFKQAFPALLLQYTDVNGQLIADQIFQPDDYLKGEMTGVEQMPVNTRIYVALAIKKPGANALNYQLLLTPASN